MSIAELGMLVNSNFNKPLNEQARELTYAGSYLFEDSTTFTPDKPGWYKVIVVGKGGDGSIYEYSSPNYYSASGGSGAVAIKTMYLSSDKHYAVEVSNVQSGFDSTIIAKAGTDGETGRNLYNRGTGGTASGGDLNYNGIDGDSNTNAPSYSRDVGVHIPELMEKTRIVNTYISGSSYQYYELYTGYGILEHGASGGTNNYGAISGQKGCVLIIPLEFEE